MDLSVYPTEESQVHNRSGAQVGFINWFAAIVNRPLFWDDDARGLLKDPWRRLESWKFPKVFAVGQVYRLGTLSQKREFQIPDFEKFLWGGSTLGLGC